MSDLAVPRQSGKTTMLVKRAYKYAVEHPETPVILLVQNEREKNRKGVQAHDSVFVY